MKSISHGKREISANGARLPFSTVENESRSGGLNDISQRMGECMGREMEGGSGEGSI